MDAYKITFLEDESNVAGSSQGDTENKWSVIYIFFVTRICNNHTISAFWI